MRRSEELERDKTENKALLRQAIVGRASLRKCVIKRKHDRPSWTLVGEEQCGECLFAYGGSLCLLHDWIVAPQMKSCNDFERPP